MAGAAVLRMGRERFGLLQEVGLGRVRQSHRLLGAIGRIDEDQFTDDFPGARAKAGRMAVDAELEKMVWVSSVEEFRSARERDRDRLDFTDMNFASCFAPLVCPPGDDDCPAEYDNLAGDGLFERPVCPFRFGLLAHRLMPLPARLSAPRRTASAGARAWSESSELLRTHFDAPGFDINAHQGRTK